MTHSDPRALAMIAVARSGDWSAVSLQVADVVLHAIDAGSVITCLLHVIDDLVACDPDPDAATSFDQSLHQAIIDAAARDLD